jgi:hypothetical protein
MRISSAKKNVKKNMLIIRNEKETEIMLPHRGKLSTGGQLLEETLESESINSPQSQFYADEHHEYLNGERTKKICFR